MHQYIEKLLNNQKVQWKTLGEVAEFRNGFAFKSNCFQEKGLPIIRITNITETRIDLTNAKYFDPKDYVKTNPLDYSIEKGDILIAMSGATTGKIGYYDYEGKAYQNQRVGKFIPHQEVLNNRYLFHFLSAKAQDLYNLAGGGAQPNLSSNDIKNKLLIPLPPLSVQHKIVEILDKFTQLETELETELNCRKRQYQYYRDKLLSTQYLQTKGPVQYKTLGEVAELKRGTSITKKTSISGEYPVISGGQQPAYYINKFNREGETITVAGSGNAGFVQYWKQPIFVADAFSIKVDNDILSTKFVFYFLQTIQSDIYKLKKEGGVPHVYAKDVARLLIPLPPLSVQHKIVAILDTFSSLCNSISEGLPKEIALRRKQYEYYRNQLLSFD